MISRTNGETLNPCGQTIRVLIALRAGFRLNELAAITEPLRAANVLFHDNLLEWEIVAERPGYVPSEGGPELLVEHSFSELTPQRVDLLVLLGGRGCLDLPSCHYKSALQRLAARSAKVMALSEAVVMIARLGLVDDCEVSLHWQELDVFAEEFTGRLTLPAKLFVEAGKIVTCGGHVGTHDAILHLLSGWLGRSAALQVADRCLIGQIREGSTIQRRDIRHRLCVESPVITRAIEAMEAHIETPLPVGQIAEYSGVSTRQLERLFRDAGIGSPGKYYRYLRLLRARWMVKSESCWKNRRGCSGLTGFPGSRWWPRTPDPAPV